MIGNTMRLVVAYADGSEQAVDTDQRDAVAFERAEKVSSLEAARSMTAIFLRGMAFFALRRQQLLGAAESREDWEARAVSAALDLETIVHPGQPVATAGPVSPSPSKQVKATGKSATAGRRKTS